MKVEKLKAIVDKAMEKKDEQQEMPVDYEFYSKMLATALGAGLPIIISDTAARIMSVLYVYGNNEAYAMSPKLKCDLQYISNRFHIRGGDIPDAQFVDDLNYYIGELKEYEANRRKSDKRFPEWAYWLFQNRYGIKLINF